MPVVDYYRQHGKVVEVSMFQSGSVRADVQVDSSPPVEVVYDNVRAAIDPRLPRASPTSQQVPLDYGIPSQNAAATV